MSVFEPLREAIARSRRKQRTPSRAGLVAAVLTLIVSTQAMPTFGQADWREHETVEPFDAAPGAASRSVLYDDQQGVYRMWYESGDHDRMEYRTGYATSEDGIDWTIEAPSVVEPGAPGALDDCRVGLPCVLFDPILGIYRLWYTASRCPGWYARIFYATSVDGVRWEKWRGGGDTAAPVLEPGPLHDWDANSARAARVLLDEDTGMLRMWYTAYGGIGYALSSDGVSWTKSPWNPVVCAPRGLDIEHAWVLSRGGALEMWYGLSADDGHSYSVRYATSIDGVTWIDHDDVLDLAFETPGAWGAYSPCVIFEEHSQLYRMWYTADKTVEGFSTVCAESPWNLPLVSFTWDEVGGPDGSEIALDAFGTELPSERTLRALEWDFGDWEGTSGQGDVHHRYAEPGRYFPVLTVTDDLGRATRASQSAIVGCEADDVSPWTAADVGLDDPFEFIPAGARFAGPSLEICAGGHPDPRGLRREPVYSRHDDVHFVYQKADGDLRWTARVEASTPEAIGAKVAFMLRESLAPAAPFAAAVLETYDGETARPFLLWRPAAGATARIAGWGEKRRATGWLRIERRGRRFAAAVSDDGDDWESLGVVTLELPRTLLYGIAVSGTEVERAFPRSYEPFQTSVADLEAVPLPLLFRRGDADSDGAVNLSDAVAVLTWLFAGGTVPACRAAADANADGEINLTDPSYLFGCLFGGRELPGPFPDCGSGSPSDDALGCAASGERCE